MDRKNSFFSESLSLCNNVLNIPAGALYLDKCPRERFIPIYLLVGGCFGVMKTIFNKGITFRHHQSFDTGMPFRHYGSDEDDSEKAEPNTIGSVVDCFLFAWLIAGKYLLFFSI